MKKPDCKNCETFKAQIESDPDNVFHVCNICERMEKYESYLESRRKYKPGKPIESWDELLEQDFVYTFGKPRHIEFVKSLQFRMIADLLNRKRINHAIRKVPQDQMCALCGKPCDKTHGLFNGTDTLDYACAHCNRNIKQAIKKFELQEAQHERTAN